MGRGACGHTHTRVTLYVSTLLLCFSDFGKSLFQFISVQVSGSVVSDSLQPHESQHTRPPCPSPTPAVYSNSCPSSQWCHPAISSSVVPFSSCPQSLPASGSFPMSQLIGKVCVRWPKYWSFTFSISPSNEHPGLISFRVFNLYAESPFSLPYLSNGGRKKSEWISSTACVLRADAEGF